MGETPSAVDDFDNDFADDDFDDDFDDDDFADDDFDNDFDFNDDHDFDDDDDHDSSVDSATHGRRLRHLVAAVLAVISDETGLRDRGCQ
jgi:hypothetical protein